ncbi:hypothetical protein [Hwangdonia seohaensis]|uniref:Uncharacterized protein n=1 Tax=Hwangdonia seohaensis TaxID=1240727 RepID=A0ABW3RCY8_9FLAO|nr:hypothetical protein [Hwangdonia seohaensis]
MSDVDFDKLFNKEPKDVRFLWSNKEKSEVKAFYEPKDVLKTLIDVLDSPKFNENVLANHLLILSTAFSIQHLSRFGHEDKFYQELYRLCQNHISGQTTNREKSTGH